MGVQIYFDNYSPVGDILVTAICMGIFVLLATSYVNKTKIYTIYLQIVVCLAAAALTDLFYHHYYTLITNGDYRLIYVLRTVFHIILFTNLLLYVIYIVEILHLEKAKKLPIMVISSILYFCSILFDAITTMTGFSFVLDESGTLVVRRNFLMIEYLLFTIIIVYLLVVYRKLLYRRVMMGCYGTMMISYLLLSLQGMHGQHSFTVASFLFPVIGMLYFIHSNPYDIEIGSVNAKALEDMVRNNYIRREKLFFMSLYLPEFDIQGRVFSKELQETIRRFSGEFFRDAVLFQISNGHVILFCQQKKNRDYKETVRKILTAFEKEYERFRFDYKIVLGPSINAISAKNAYIGFIWSLHQKMHINEIHQVDERDVATFEEYEYILSELTDISKQKDLDDPRVLAYCQPVYNLRTGSYDTAEALMRLDLPKMGIVQPMQFIPIAEQYGYIHMLTEIILHKTCTEIRNLMESGYIVNRISVKVSSTEIREESFASDVSRIISGCGIPEDKIAIEITESQSETDFMRLKTRIEEMRGRGIKFYLDDFGTGYSNMERILELPFDIIKFDRSLVLASHSNARSEKMIGSLANMFSELEYSVLYEGIESERDELRCINMSATYLQGYKYSRPIPIADLDRFFSTAKGVAE